MNRTTVNLEALTAEFKQAMQQLYGERLAKVILFGSYARGDFHPESDVDFMIVLKDMTIVKMDEFDRLYPVSSALSEKYNVPISVMPVDEKRFTQKADYLFFKNVRREGVLL